MYFSENRCKLLRCLDVLRLYIHLELYRTTSIKLYEITLCVCWINDMLWKVPYRLSQDGSNSSFLEYGIQERSSGQVCFVYRFVFRDIVN